VSAHAVKSATAVKAFPEAARTGSGARSVRSNIKNEELMKYMTKTFPGRGSLPSQPNGQLYIQGGSK